MTLEIELTDDDKKNGWTLETLRAYHEEQLAVEAARIPAMFDRRPARPRWANSRYSPLRWRG